MEPDDIAVASDFGLRDAFKLVRAGLSTDSASSRPSLFLGVYRSNARIIVPERECVAFAGMGEHGRIFLSLSTRFEDVDGFRAPRELRYIVISHAPDIEVALDYLYGTAHRFHNGMQLVVNAAADMIQETLVQEIQDFFPGAFFRQTEFTLPRLPRNGRIVDGALSGKVVNASFGLPPNERDRFERAADHYCTALSHWREGEIPLAMMHLYIGVESICKAISRNVQRREGITEEKLYDRYGVAGKEHPDTALLHSIRLQKVFRGDAATAKAARDASDGIEHGFADYKKVWELSRKAYEKTASYLRRALFDMLDLGDETMESLTGARFGDVLVEQPRYWESGVYDGDLITRWRDLDFRMVDTVPFVKEMRLDDERGTYDFTIDWNNEFNYAKKWVVVLPTATDANAMPPVSEK